MNIQPTTSVNLPLNGEATQLEITVNDFNLLDPLITVTWQVLGNMVSKQGVIIIPPSILSPDGMQYSVIETYVLEQLDLTAAI